ncbi:M48 family metallopeptidase [Wenyingzhuangia sp. 2_MG-2023]|uniref:M48 family metallopeptidase n=1 Tax=Wenyingzhuangia sp. 2_MG-2023 TaxID=3062639 RepID=UPI0026E2EBEC|nr:M48 family metallopeptidase [Wenyingzhuangia sp. 2_MG-2023]MDO6737231.1 M48 family metallopeptidase [Wenyingzhuangia sp. 2_MG-2023]
MTGSLLFAIIITVLVVNYLKDELISFVNAKHFNDPVPTELQDVYDAEAYQKSQEYKLANYNFSKYSGLFSFVLTLMFFGLGGVALVDQWSLQITEQPILHSLVFFGIVGLASSVLQIPFDYYHTFVIEEKFGFNKSTKKLFWLDKIKGLLMSVVLGGAMLSLIAWLYLQMEDRFWWYAWLVFAVFTLFFTLFYSSLIVPLFNKQAPLEEGSLKEKLFTYTATQGFKLNNIFVIDGSKRSTKANAYFTGFGPKKRIVLYDTLINDLSEDEIVAVFAHEVGHYKRKHTVYNMVLSLGLTGFTLYVLGILLGNPLLSAAFEVEKSSFHIGLLAFGILYTPISEITGLLMNVLSRKFEYQADDFAKETYEGRYLISSLKKLSKNSLSNLTPHKWNVFFHYSHPTLLQRVLNLKNTRTS